jgi:hypothetical protein
MNTTHDDNATTWRDLADQLTPKQVASFECMERRLAEGGGGDHQARASLVEHAREYAQHNLIDAAHPRTTC